MILKFKINRTGLHVLNFVKFRKLKIYKNVNNKLLYMRMSNFIIIHNFKMNTYEAGQHLLLQTYTINRQYRLCNILYSKCQ